MNNTITVIDGLDMAGKSTLARMLSEAYGVVHQPVSVQEAGAENRFKTYCNLLEKGEGYVLDGRLFTCNLQSDDIQPAIPEELSDRLEKALKERENVHLVFALPGSKELYLGKVRSLMEQTGVRAGGIHSSLLKYSDAYDAHVLEYNRLKAIAPDRVTRYDMFKVLV